MRDITLLDPIGTTKSPTDIAGKLYKDRIVYVDDRPGHDYRYAIDATKIKREIGWEPKESFEAGIQKTVLWYLENKGWWKKIQKHKYKQQRLGITK